MSSLTDAKRINQRMHSKMFVADNALAVTGGRNLGDAYFLQSPKSNFVDLDVMVAGPAVRTLSDSFDRFWNSELAYPVEVLVKSKPDCAGPVSAKPAGEPASRASGTSVASAAAELPGASQAEAARQAWPGNAPGEPSRDSVPVPDVPLAREMSAGRLEPGVGAGQGAGRQAHRRSPAKARPIAPRLSPTTSSAWCGEPSAS